ncbi:MAG: cyclic nucleotide-binding/CBS domain-containing protein [Candidatus Woesearchaeota archaeon]
MQTGYKVIDVMTNKPIVAQKDISLKEAATLMTDTNVNSLLIVEGDKAIGILTDEDLVRKVIAKGIDSKKTKVSDIMETDLVSIEPGRDMYDALQLMRNHNIRQLPVIEKKKLIGFLTAKDILKIQPELFDLFIEKYELKEEERKLSAPPEEEDDMFSEFFRKIGIKKK